MEIKSNEATQKRPDGDRIIDASLVNIDLPAFVHQIKNEDSWEENDRNAITVFKTSCMRVVLVALHKDAEMKRHTNAGVISIQMLEGEIEFETDDKCIVLHKGQMLALHEEIPHSVVAKEESVFLFTLCS